MNFKQEYQKYNEEIQPDKALVEEVRLKAREKEEKHRHRASRTVRVAWTAAAVCICVCFGVPVLAANVPPVYRLVSQVSPELAQLFMPVQESDEDQGIRMEVVAAYIHDNEAGIYIAMQDLEGDRIDETTDLYDSYYINTRYSCASGCQRLGYDEETGTVTFLITISQWEGQDIEKERVTFGVREFISRKQEYEDVEIPISLSEAEEKPETMSVYLNGIGGMNQPDELEPVTLYDDKGNYVGTVNNGARVLTPGMTDDRFPVAGMEFTGMGYVDGMLHIQHAAPNHLENDNHGYFFLRDTGGNERYSDYSLHFKGQTEETENIVYEDDVFAISPSELSNYTLYGYFMTSGLRVEGDWRVTFSLGDMAEGE